MTRAEFSEDNIAPYALEHNERHPLKWSKHGGANEFETDINPGDPAVTAIGLRMLSHWWLTRLRD